MKRKKGGRGKLSVSLWWKNRVSVSVSLSVPTRPGQAITHCSVPLPPQQASGLEHNSLKFFLILHCFLADDAADMVGDSG